MSRQAHSQGGADAERARDLHRSAMRLDMAANQGKAETGPAFRGELRFAGPVEWLEYEARSSAAMPLPLSSTMSSRSPSLH